jgi:hypothetical protein
MSGSRRIEGAIVVPFEEKAEAAHPLTNFVKRETDSLIYQTYVLDGIICDQIALIAGSAGVGKTSSLIPLFMKVAHLCKADDPLKPEIRRRVIYITEDVVQAENILMAVRKSGAIGNVAKEEVDDFFRIVPAKRMSAEEIVQVAGDYRDLAYLNKNQTEEGYFEYLAMPLTVFDTANSTIDLNNENDNAEVGKSIATLKQEFGGIPVVIVAHTAKAIKKADIASMSSRGAGAWEGDVNQVLYLTLDEDSGPNHRWLEVGDAKHRFSSKVKGLSLSVSYYEEFVRSPLGKWSTVSVAFCEAEVMTKEDRDKVIEEAKSRKEEEKESNSGKDRDLKCDQMIEFIKWAWKNPTTEKPPSARSVRSKVRGRAETLSDYMSDMIARGKVVEIEIPQELRRNNNSKTVLYGLDHDEFVEFEKTGICPVSADMIPREWLSK